MLGKQTTMTNQEKYGSYHTMGLSIKPNQGNSAQCQQSANIRVKLDQLTSWCTRLREEQVPVISGVEVVFHQLKVSYDQKSLRRFLW